MYKVKVTSSFSAAHSLEGYPGDCCNLHGHNWRLMVTILCPSQDEIGMAIDFRKVKQILNPIVTDLDHKHLNSLDCFNGKNPTSEELAKYIYNRLEPYCIELNCKLLETEIWESENASIVYYKDSLD